MADLKWQTCSAVGILIVAFCPIPIFFLGRSYSSKNLAYICNSSVDCLLLQTDPHAQKNKTDSHGHGYPKINMGDMSILALIPRLF